MTVNKYRKIKVVFLLQDLEFGGTQRYALNLLKHLDRSVFSPQLWVMRYGRDMIHLAKEVGVEPIFLSRSYYVGPQSLARLFPMLLKERPDLLYTMTVVPNTWGRLFGRLVRVPAIISSWRGMYPKQYESLLCRFSSKIICNADILRRIMMTQYGVAPEKIEVIPNGVDPEQYKPRNDLRSPNPRILYLGRLVKDKDPITLARGFVMAAQKEPKSEFEIIGNGKLKPHVEAIIEKHDLGRRIKILPGIPDAREHLHKSWVFAMSSYREACPNAILEAMSCGIPIVATKVGGIPELVRNGMNGLLYEPKDSEGLARSLLELIRDHEKREKFGQQARQDVLEKFTMNSMIDRTQKIMLDVIPR